ncbi:unnamed protein product [Cuscuta europaea]|uniref:Photosystem I reaction center subunit III n=1 Tax=Cuscuta europaea TaxID=41803 RepID=A0A9P0ZU49_CUSEU|nr:unnamed protein product [Cuscuta europaea]
MSLAVHTNLSKPFNPPTSKSITRSTRSSTIVASSSSPSGNGSSEPSSSSLKAFSAALALSSVIMSAPVLPATADISGLTPCNESKQFAKREKQQVKKLETALKKYDPESAPALALKATIERTHRRFDSYGKQGLLCGSDGLPHLIVNGDQRHWGEFITPGLLFLYIAGWIGWAGRSYLIAVRDEKKPTQKEIIIDVPLANRLIWKAFSWPVSAYREYRNGELVDPNF